MKSLMDELRAAQQDNARLRGELAAANNKIAQLVADALETAAEVDDHTAALGELGDATAGTMDALAELGDLVAQMMEG